MRPKPFQGWRKLGRGTLDFGRIEGAVLLTQIFRPCTISAFWIRIENFMSIPFYITGKYDLHFLPHSLNLLHVYSVWEKSTI